MTEAGSTAVLAAVEPDLAEHVIELLAVGGVVAVDRPLPDGRIAIVVRAAELEQARDTLALVLPGVVDGPRDRPASGRLSDRLVRSAEVPPAPPSEVQPGALDESGEPLLYDPATEDDYIPPEPPPLPRGDLGSRLGWLGAAGGPMLMVIAVLLDLPSVYAAAGLVGFVVGFGVLVARMPDRARQDDGWDDGAVL